MSRTSPSSTLDLPLPQRRPEPGPPKRHTRAVFDEIIRKLRPYAERERPRNAVACLPSAYPVSKRTQSLLISP